MSRKYKKLSLLVVMINQKSKKYRKKSKNQNSFRIKLSIALQSIL
jgi:hypothetical protein